MKHKIGERMWEVGGGKEAGYCSVKRKEKKVGRYDHQTI